MEPNTPQLNMAVKCSDALGLPLPTITAAGAASVVQAAWYDEDKQHHTYATIDRLGIITAVWRTSLDAGGFISTESNPMAVVDIFQAHKLPLGSNVLGEQDGESDFPLELSDDDALQLIYMLRNAHGFIGEIYGVTDAIAALEGGLGSEEELRQLADDGVLMDALRNTDAWVSLDEIFETDETFNTLIRQAAEEAAPALGRAMPDSSVPAPVAASEVSL